MGPRPAASDMPWEPAPEFEPGALELGKVGRRACAEKRMTSLWLDASRLVVSVPIVTAGPATPVELVGKPAD